MTTQTCPMFLYFGFLPQHLKQGLTGGEKKNTKNNKMLSGTEPQFSILILFTYRKPVLRNPIVNTTLFRELSIHSHSLRMLSEGFVHENILFNLMVIT